MVIILIGGNMYKLFVSYSLFALLLLLTPLQAFSFPNEPDGFRGLKFGSSPPEGFAKLVQRGKTSVYKNPSDELSLFGQSVISIEYHYFDAKLNLIRIITPWQNFGSIFGGARKRFGESFTEPHIDGSPTQNFYWNGDAASFLMYGKNNGGSLVGYIEIFHKQLADESFKASNKNDGM